MMPSLPRLSSSLHYYTTIFYSLYSFEGFVFVGLLSSRKRTALAEICFRANFLLDFALWLKMGSLDRLERSDSGLADFGGC